VCGRSLALAELYAVADGREITVPAAVGFAA
jgi:hypothetical protein